MQLRRLRLLQVQLLLLQLLQTTAAPQECFDDAQNVALNYDDEIPNIKLICQEGSNLDEVDLSRCEPKTAVRRVMLVQCRLPKEGLRKMLATFNVTIDDVDELYVDQMPHVELNVAMFAGMNLTKLRLRRDVKPTGRARATVTSHFLASLDATLRDLTLFGVQLSDRDAIELPSQLRLLKIQDAGLHCDDGCGEALRRLEALKALWLLDELRGAPTLQEAKALREAYVTGPVAGLSREVTLRNATFMNIETFILDGCGAVENLVLYGAKMERLPSDWMRECGRLKSLKLTRLSSLTEVAGDAQSGAAKLARVEISDCKKLRRLPSRLFADNVALVEVNLARNSLEDLPADLFGIAPAKHRELRSLDLSRNRLQALPTSLLTSVVELRQLLLADNRLKQLPSGLFASVKHLSELDASRNELEPASKSLGALRDVTRLTTLRLDHNPMLGDLCPHPYGGSNHRFELPVSSILQKEQFGLSELEELQLSNTSASRVCFDWRHELRRLRRLSLARNGLTQLTAAELQWPALPTSVTLDVDLSDNPLTQIVVLPVDLDSLDSVVLTPKVDIKISSKLHCDCTMYWFELARRSHRLPANIRELRCEQPEPRPQLLAKWELVDLKCRLNSSMGCPPTCDCFWTPEGNFTTVDCSGRHLDRLPMLTGEILVTKRLDLNVSHNQLTTFPDSLPESVRMIDLRHNSISGSGELEEQRAERLMKLHTIDGGVFLSGNPLHCGCGRDVLRVLSELRPKDFTLMRCANNNTVSAAISSCTSLSTSHVLEAKTPPVLWLLLGLLVVTLSAVAALLLQRDSRRRLKTFLLSHGLCRHWLRYDDEDCDYDAFLSYAHADSAFADELVQRLESGDRPLRVCVHHRDWRVGDWIPAQIAHSVARSRRTVLLLSDAFVASGWARAEFREATAHALRHPRLRPRVVVVLLQESPPADLDAELRHYVANNTYLKRSDPAFWDKLRRALPSPPPPRRPTRAPRSLKRKARAAALAVLSRPAPTPTSVPSSPKKRPPALMPPPLEVAVCA